jgi:hypothetical protein
MNEFYKSLLGASTSGGSSSGSTASTAAANAALAALTPQQQIALMTDPMSSIMSSLFTTPSPTSSPKAASSYEKKYLESIKNIAYGSNSSLMGLQQNLMSNSLSITTTTMTASTSTQSKSSASKSQATLTKKTPASLKEPQVSITKSDSSKYNALRLPDLPKSLSITPSMPSAMSTKVNRVSDKGKIQKAKQSTANFGRSSLTITGEPGMQGSYQDFLKNYMPRETQPTSKPKPSMNLAGTAASSSLLKPQKHKPSPQLPTSNHPKKSHTASRLPYEYNTLPMSSPTLSISPYQHSSPSLSPSVSGGNVVSPQKTLQQKLAERKQQNQQAKKKQGEKSPEKSWGIQIEFRFSLNSQMTT